MSSRARLAASLGGVLAVLGALIFGAAGTFDYPRAWIFLSIYAAASILLTVDLARTAPDLLRRRLEGGPLAEREPAQKIAMSLASAGFLALFVVAGLDRRFGWSHVPAGLVMFGDGLHLAGWLGIAAVFRANRYAAATVVVEAGQTVVSVGPYAVLRHPMYAAALILLAGVPLALGSWWALLAVAALVPALVWRLLDEERVLAEQLPGYRDYMRRQRWRLVPGLW